MKTETVESEKRSGSRPGPYSETPPANAQARLFYACLFIIGAVCNGVFADEVGGGTVPTTIYENLPAATPATPIDKLVFDRLAKLGIQPAAPCSDAVFVRRAFLDAIGTIPTAQEAREFLESKAPDKRQNLIDRLLARTEFADYWTMKWADLLRMQSEFPINLWPNAAQEYSRWVHFSLLKNKPYDQFARELLTASGNDFRDPPSNFYRAVAAKKPLEIAKTVALTFMGERADKWSKDRLDGMTKFFAQIGYNAAGEWKGEIVFFDPGKATNAAAYAAVFPDGTQVQLLPDQDPRGVFADWLLSPQNPWFARNIVNRIWSWLLGRGIIEPADDICPDHPPCNPELLAYLEKELRASHYDLKTIYRLILNSQVYQLSPVSRTTHPAGVTNFACYAVRRLDAEVLIDAVCKVTDTTEKYVNGTPAPFRYPLETKPSVLLTDGGEMSSFLSLFGRPGHATGLESERNNQISSDQELHMLNSSHIRAKLESSKRIKNLSTTDLYLTILSRFPTEKESQIAQGVTEDLAWALVNTAEFSYRH